MRRAIFWNAPLFALLVVFGLMSPAPVWATSEIPEAELGTNGIHVQPWFKKTTYDLRSDLAAAKAEGKTLAVIWEQIGCTYCLKMHMVNLRNHVIVNYIKKNFYVVQLDLRGDNQVTDFNGETMTEAKLAARHGVNGTPIIEFRKGDGEEVFRLPGYAEPLIFYGIFEYVANGGYKTASLGDWLGERWADGKDPLAGS
ncbi:MAG: thioredoxin family protein [Alphaproteobacteria bacterium]